ncbi:fumarate hydratase [Aeromonas hydrophila]|nr:fumarate hydratase [Aeromonas hydrophila]ORJ67265.1 fumarate hydratase [Aeromonas hydrophila]OSO88388.1 fumarate hydratase [Aeromonas hydrophila]HAU4858515.1 fumarate hydratase [Aeromonas hydrophila]HAU4863425.1 fumarate hydratase [Aeromonas hydrophila]
MRTGHGAPSGDQNGGYAALVSFFVTQATVYSLLPSRYGGGKRIIAAGIFRKNTPLSYRADRQAAWHHPTEARLIWKPLLCIEPETRTSEDDMSIIKKQDFIDSIADALQYISYYHPLDFVQAAKAAYDREINPAAKDALAQILINSRMSAEGHRPLCQDTGIVTCFVKIGMQVQWDSDMTVQEMVDEGTRRAYTNPDNPLRASVLADPAGSRKNTKDNAPAVVHIDMIPGDKVEVSIAAKGGGSENKSKMVMLNPSDDVVEWVLKTVPTMGAGWCPPGMLGIGIGGTAEKAAVLAKEALMEHIDIQELIARGPETTEEKLRVELYDKVNKLGIGAQGLGGLTTVLDVKVKSAPTHAASKPVVMIPNCAATRHVHFELDGSGPAELTPPKLEDWPEITRSAGSNVRRVNVDGITKAELASWKSGDTVLLSGKILTGRDAAHKRIADMLKKGEGLPEGVDFTNRFIYYVGPVDAVRDEVVGPAGPTTSTRMDKFTDMMLGETGLIGMIGKSERGPKTVESIKQHQAVYLMAVGGAAYLVAKAIKKARVVAFADLGMEAIYEFEVEDMPVTVAVDSQGNNIHETGPAYWSAKIAELDGKLA